MRSATWLLLSLSLVRAQAADMYALDPVNTRISFNIRYFGTPWVSTRFPDFGGEFVLDRYGAASRVDVSVQMASVDCHDSYWNGRLRSPDWLDVQRYPQMSFHSDHIEFRDGDRALASGDLSLHGITHRVELEISQLSCPGPGAASAAGDSCSFVAHARVKRSDYGLAHGLWMGGNQVDIAISGVGLRRDALPPRSAGGAAAPQHGFAADNLTRLR
jgi:polyisoprenoid-binding protein YceI